MNQTLETERTVLGIYSDSDYSEFIALVTDLRVMKYVDEGAYDIEKAESLWSKVVAGLPESHYRWCVRRKSDGAYLGHSMLTKFPPDNDYFELGYILKKSFWGIGFATEICAAVCEFVEEKIGHKKVYATVEIAHQKSISVLIKNGFEFNRIESPDKDPYHSYVRRF